MSQGLDSAFLGETQMIDTGVPDTILIYAPFSLDQFHQDLFEAYDIALPPQLSSAVDKRRADFLAGRALVARGFAELGLDQADVGIAPDRAPIWPAGVTGSISHSRTVCACLLSRNDSLRLGVDIETNLSAKSDRAVRHVALGEAELDLIDAQPNTQLLAALIFSAKETLFKALYPIVQEFFGFDAAAMHTLPSATEMTLHLTKTLHPTLPGGSVFTIRHAQLENQILTWLIHEA